MKNKLSNIIGSSFFAVKVFWEFEQKKIIIEVVLSALKQIAIVLNSIWLLHFISEKITNGSTFFSIYPVLVLFFVLNMVLACFQNAYSQWIQPKLDNSILVSLNKFLIEKVDKLPLLHFENSNTYNIMDQSKNAISNTIFSAYTNIMTICGNVAALVSVAMVLINIDPFLLLFAFFTFPMIVISKKLGNIISEKKLKLTNLERVKSYYQNLWLSKEFAREFKTTNSASIPDKYFEKASEESIMVHKDYGSRLLLWDLLSKGFSITFVVVACYLYGVFAYCYSKQFSISEFGIMFVAIMNVISRLNKIFKCYENASGYFVELNALKEFWNFQTEDNDCGVEIPEKFETLEFKQVWFSYDKKNYVLKDISFKINAGEKTTIVGYNGAGKSTIIKLILRFYDADKGEIFYNGKNIKQYDLKKYREKFSAMFQDFYVFSIRLSENITMQTYNVDGISKIREQLLATNLDELVGLENHFIGREYNKNGVVLSGGQKQKLAVSRLAFDSFDIAILDEPSASLDPISEKKTFESLMKIIQNRTIILISHSMSSVKSSDKILFLNMGVLSGQGTHNQLLAQNKTYSDFYNCQANKFRNKI